MLSPGCLCRLERLYRLNVFEKPEIHPRFPLWMAVIVLLIRETPRIVPKEKFNGVSNAAILKNLGRDSTHFSVCDSHLQWPANTYE